MKFALIVIALILSCSVYSQPLLKTHDSLSKTIDLDTVHSYLVKVKKGNYYKLEFLQQGIDLTIELKMKGRTDTLYDSPIGLNGSEFVEFVATGNGNAVLKVIPLDDKMNARRGAYTVRFLHEISAVEYTRMETDFMNWIRGNAIPLSSLKANSGFEDLQPLKSLFMDKRVIAFGEATHGTKEFFQTKHRMLEFLVMELGFRVFAIEANYGRCKYVNDYVLTGKGSLDTAINVLLFFVWRTEEVKEMIQWIRKYNIAHPDDKVQFVGYDLQANEAEIFEISKYYRKVEPSISTEVDTLLKKVKNLKRRGGVISGDTSVRTLASLVDRMILNYIMKEGEYVIKSSKAEYDEILWDQKVLRQFFLSFSTNDFYERSKSRDFYMAQNILSWLNFFPKGTKMMVWAHNGHVAKDYQGNIPVPSMGSFLKEKLGDDYYAVGFDFYKGKFGAFSRDTDTTGGKGPEVGEAPRGNLSSYFVRSGTGNAFLDFTRTAKNENIKYWLNEKTISTYMIGAMFSRKEPLSNYLAPMKLKSAFDGIIFIRESNRAVPSEWIPALIYDF